MGATRDGAKILVVDDSAVVRAVVTGCLKRAGYVVVEASEGQAALERMQATRFDVVVTDLNMPGMSGLDLIRRIRASSDCPETVVLTCSGPQEAPRAVEALRLGAHDYLTKPPQSAEVIVSAVDRALETKRRRDESVRFLEDLQALTPPLQSASAHC